jgi:hypothetical protein
MKLVCLRERPLKGAPEHALPGPHPMLAITLINLPFLLHSMEEIADVL